MRGHLPVLSALLSGLLCFAPLLEAQAQEAEPSASATEPSPAELYEQGRKAYRLGDFERAVGKWERAYELSDRPLLLYNISLAYKGLYGITKDIADLRRARAVLDSFIKLAEADPEIDLDDAPERLAELDEMLVEAEKGLEPKLPPAPPPRDEKQQPEGPDPGRTLKLTGIGLMAGGGGVLLIGVGLGSYFAFQSGNFSQQLRDENEAARQEGCDLNAPQDVDCEQRKLNIDSHRENGQAANTAAYATFGVTGGVGLAAIIAGAVLYSKGKKKTTKWKQSVARHELRLHVGAQMLSISGRF